MEEEKKGGGEQAAEDDDLSNYDRVDQGFFRNLISKLGSGELSHSRWNIGQLNEIKKCSFTDDERYLLVITNRGQFHKLEIHMGENSLQPPKSLLTDAIKKFNPSGDK